MSGAAMLLLADARFPAGGHAHSGGVEPAATAATVTDISSLEVFLRGRLRTAGLTSAGLAAAACAHVAARAHANRDGPRGSGTSESPSSVRDKWVELDLEADARIPSPAQRGASRRQGRALLRAARAAWPDAPWWAELAAASTASSAERSTTADGGPHHAIVLGAATAAAGGTPHEAAEIAAYQSVSGPASAAVRLLALDPMRVAAVLAGLAAEIDAIAARAARHADGPLAELPFPSAPALDLLAEAHVRMEVRLFES